MCLISSLPNLFSKEEGESTNWLPFLLWRRSWEMEEKPQKTLPKAHFNG